MKILITGATGFVGKFLVKKLKEKAHDVYCLVKATSDISDLAPLGVNFITGDLTDIYSLYEAVKDKNYVYHLAIARSPASGEATYAVNALGTGNLIKACHEKGPVLKKFVYVSSLAAAGYSRDGVPLRETDPPHPVTHYGMSKLQGEQAVLSYKDKLPVVILRPPTVVGPGNLFLSYIRTTIEHGIKPLWRGYTSLCDIDDLIEGMILAAESHRAASQIYYICDGHRYSWEEIVNAIASYSAGKKINVFLPRFLLRAAVPWSRCFTPLFHKPHVTNKIIELTYAYWLCDPSKIQRELGFRCKRDFKASMDAWHAAVK